LGSKEGSPYRSWAVHGVDGRADELDGDSVAYRLRVAVDGPKRVGHRWGPHCVVAGMEEDRRQRCAWRRSRQLGRRGVVGDRPEERSVVL
jgi:hypothetical protein